MKFLTASLLTSIALTAACPVWAQTAETPAADAPAEGAAATDAPAEGGEVGGDLSTGEPVGDLPAVGEAYIKEEFDDWSIRCIRSGEANDPCQLYQLMQDQEGNPVAEISLFPLPEGQQAAAGATIITPLETLLTQQVTFQVDSGQAKRYAFTFCSQVGCVARIGFLAEEIESFRRGARATVRIVPAAAPDNEVFLTLSLKGFTAGYAAIAEGVNATPEASGN